MTESSNKALTISVGCPEVRNLPEAVKSKGVSLALIRKEQGEEIMMSFLQAKIAQLCRFFNITQPMTPEQITETAKLIYSEYYFLKVPQIDFIFRQAKLGVYGQIYNRIDGGVIMRWFNEYWNGHVAHCEGENYTKETDRVERRMTPDQIGNIIPDEKYFE